MGVLCLFLIDLGPNCLQSYRLTTRGTASKFRVTLNSFFYYYYRKNEKCRQLICFNINDTFQKIISRISSECRIQIRTCFPVNLSPGELSLLGVGSPTPTHIPWLMLNLPPPTWVSKVNLFCPFHPFQTIFQL